jgi:hypothetical protein
MIGFRVFDIGLLVIWLVWFLRLRNDDDDQPDDDGSGGGGSGPRLPRNRPGGGGLSLPLGKPGSVGYRLRGHNRPKQRFSRRGTDPLPGPLPSRVRRPRLPLRTPNVD